MDKILKFKNLILFFCFLLLFGSCDDFLTETDPNKQTNETFWKTLNDADQGLIAVYNRFKDANLFGSDIQNWSDLTFPGYGNRTLTTNELYLHTYTNSTPRISQIWKALYNGIFRANQVIAGMNTVIYEENEKDRAQYILGQAYFFRGLFYFYLYNTYNNGSVPLRTTDNMNELYVGLSPATEIRKYFIQDLDSAYKLLPDNWRSSSKDLGRVTKGAAAAILGQTYLYEKDYAKAKVYFEDIINNQNYGNTNGYRLVDNISDNFNLAGELNDESILEICYSKNYLKDKNGGSEDGVSSNLARSLASPTVGGWGALIPSCWLEFAYREDPIDTTDIRNRYANGKLRRYSLRLAKSIACSQDTSSIAYGKKQYLTYSYAARQTSFFKKFTNWETSGVTSEDHLLSQSGINARVIRLADIYLLYAECLIEGGTNDNGVNEALKYINRIRHRSALQLLGMNDTGEFTAAGYDNNVYTAESLMEHIKWKERPMELSIEGFCTRHIDLRRWGNVKERFELLSQQAYGFSPFVYKDGNLTVTRWTGVLTKLNPPLPNDYVTEFSKAAQSYTEDSDYFPIPSSEETSNPYLYK